MSTRTTVAVLLAVSTAGLLLSADQPPADAQLPDLLTVDSSAVVVDVAVRDRRGRPVGDLKKDDFELLEDGVPQVIGDVTIVGSSAVAPGRPGARASSPSPSSGRVAGEPARNVPTFLAMVFDSLTAEARVYAYQGALAYLDAPGGPDDFAGVFLADQALYTIEAFTNDSQRIRSALHRVGVRATSAGYPTRPPEASAEYDSNGPAASAGGGASAAIIRALVARAEATWERLALDRQGYATTQALLALTSALGTLPGRKTIVFFSEGLSLPDAVMPHFRRVVAVANAVNVTFYTIDAAGLRAHSEQMKTAREIRQMGNAGLTLNEDGSSQSDLRMLERNEYALRRDPHVGLTMLARETGGFLIDTTNDLARGFRDIDADRRSYYLLTYAPRNAEFRGEWRKIEVKVRKSGVQVRSRTGYLATSTPAR